MYNAQSVVVKYDDDDEKFLVRHNLFVVMCTLGFIKVLLMVLKIFSKIVYHTYGFIFRLHKLYIYLF